MKVHKSKNVRTPAGDKKCWRRSERWLLLLLPFSLNVMACDKRPKEDYKYDDNGQTHTPNKRSCCLFKQKKNESCVSSM